MLAVACTLLLLGSMVNAQGNNGDIFGYLSNMFSPNSQMGGGSQPSVFGQQSRNPYFNMGNMGNMGNLGNMGNMGGLPNMGNSGGMRIPGMSSGGIPYYGGSQPGGSGQFQFPNTNQNNNQFPGGYQMPTNNQFPGGYQMPTNNQFPSNYQVPSYNQVPYNQVPYNQVPYNPNKYWPYRTSTTTTTTPAGPTTTTTEAPQLPVECMLSETFANVSPMMPCMGEKKNGYAWNQASQTCTQHEYCAWGFGNMQQLFEGSDTCIKKCDLSLIQPPEDNQGIPAALGNQGIPAALAPSQP